jgi:hypothetical protein
MAPRHFSLLRAKLMVSTLQHLIQRLIIRVNTQLISLMGVVQGAFSQNCFQENFSFLLIVCTSHIVTSYEVAEDTQIFQHITKFSSLHLPAQEVRVGSLITPLWQLVFTIGRFIIVTHFRAVQAFLLYSACRHADRTISSHLAMRSACSL